MDNKEIIRNQLHRLLDIVIDTNGLEPRKQDVTGTLPTMFFEYMGHVNLLKINVCPDGWCKGAGSEYLLETYLDEPIKDKKIERIEAMCSKYLNKEKEPSAATDDSNSEKQI